MVCTLRCERGGCGSIPQARTMTARNGTAADGRRHDTVPWSNPVKTADSEFADTGSNPVGTATNEDPDDVRDEGTKR